MLAFYRFLQVMHAIGRYRLDTLIPIKKMPLWFRLCFIFWPWRWFYRPKMRAPVRLRLCLESLGPVHIKFGQLLSTRRDLLSPALAEELARLQDKVAGFPPAQAIKIIEHSLGAPITELFVEFTQTPLASASVAQVHEALLTNGEEVVVKVIRPDIAKTIRRDIRLLYLLARMITLFTVDGKRLRPLEVVYDFEHTITKELDLQREAANISQLARNFTDSNLLYVPKVYWHLNSKSVLVMERIHGIAIADIAQLKSAGINLKELAERGVEIFFTQVFRDSFFHADMHPGNIFVEKHKMTPRYIAIDCGIMGSLTPEDQYYLAQNLLAFFRHNYRAVAQLHIDSEWVPATTSLIELEAAIRTVCEPIAERPLKDISFAQLLLRLFEISRQFNMPIQPQLLLLQKTLINIEGLGRQLYPDLDLWKTALPFIERWVRARTGPLGVLKNLKNKAPAFLEKNFLCTHLSATPKISPIAKMSSRKKAKPYLVGTLFLLLFILISLKKPLQALVDIEAGLLLTLGVIIGLLVGS